MMDRRDFDTGVAGAADEVDRHTSRMDGAFGRMLGTVGKVGLAVGAAAIGIGAAVGGMGLKTAAANEQAAIGFETLLGSAEKAQGFMGELADFAARTPFEMAGLRDSASRFLAVGVEAQRVIPIMTTLGDATAAMGTGSEGIDRATTALTQMAQKGKVSAEEMLQLTEAGIPAWDALAAKLGTDVAGAQELVTKRQVEANTMFEALEERAGPALGRVAGMMDRQAESLSGMISTLKDTVTQGLAGAMGPAVDIIKGAMPQVTEAIGGALTQLGPALGEALGAIAPAIGPVISLLGTLVTALTPVLTVVGEVVGALAQELSPVLTQMAPHLGLIVESLGQLLLAIVPLVPPLLELVVALLPIIPPVVDLATMIVNLLVPALNWLVGLITDIVAPTIRAIAGVLKEPMEPLRALGDFFREIWDRIVGFVSRAKDNISDRINGVIDFFRELPGRILGAIGDLGTLLIEAGEDLIRGLIAGMKGMVTAAINAVKGVVGGVVDGAKRLLGIGSPSKVFAAIGMQTMEGLALGLRSGESEVMRQIAGTVSAVSALDAPSVTFGVSSGSRGAAIAAGHLPSVTNVYNVTVQAGWIASEDAVADRVKGVLRHEALYGNIARGPG